MGEIMSDTNICRANLTLSYGTPFVVAYGHHVSKLRHATPTLYYLSTSYPGRPVHYTCLMCELYCITCEHKWAYTHKAYTVTMQAYMVTV